MEIEYVRHLHEKLRRRKQRLRPYNDPALFHQAVRHLWGYLNNEPAIAGLVGELMVRSPQMEDEAEKVWNRQLISVDTESDYIAACLYFLRKYVESDQPSWALKVGELYKREVLPNAPSSSKLENFITTFLSPLLDYLDEKLDEQGAMLGILLRYKTNCEWFERGELYELALERHEGKLAQREKRFQRHLYKYLHNHGWNITIEPSSPSGEIDFLADQLGDDRLAADTKVFGPKTGKSYILDGFRQLYDYIMEHNEPCGYLIVFRIREEPLVFSLSKKTNSIPYMSINGKVIFLLCIDVCQYSESASKRGRMKTVVVSEADLMGEVGLAEDKAFV